MSVSTGTGSDNLVLAAYVRIRTRDVVHLYVRRHVMIALYVNGETYAVLLEQAL